MGWLKAEIYEEKGKIHFIISNSYLDRASKKIAKGGVGLTNIRQRLTLLYPNKHSLTMQQSQGVFTAQLQLELPSMNSYQCLIVDVERPALQLLTAYLKKMPQLTLVSSCENAMEALAVLQSHPIDLLFLDIQMPEFTVLTYSRCFPANHK